MAAKVGDFQGTGGNLGVVSTILRDDVVDKIFEREPNITPLLIMLRKAAKARGTSFEHKWFEHEDPDPRTQVNNGGGYTAGATSIVVDDATVFAVNDLLVVHRTDEVMHITAVNTSTNAVTATRSWGTTAAAALLDNDYVSSLGSAPLEGAASELGQSVNEVQATNYMQDFRDPYGITDIQAASETYGGNYLANKRAQRGRDHKKSIELAFFFGEKVTNTGGDERRSSLGGLKEWITTYSKDFGGAVTWPEVLSAAQDNFRYGSDEKLLIGAPGVISSVANLAEPALRVSPPATKFGIKMRRLMAQHGDYILVKQNLFVGDDYGKLAFVVDPAAVAYVWLGGNGMNLDTHLRRDVRSDPSVTAIKEEWRTVCTLRRVTEERCGIWTNAA